jgi:hypothetical protein
MEEYKVSKEETEQLLKRIGWSAADIRHVERYANMEPSRKVALVMKWHRIQVKMLRKQYRAEYPNATDREIMCMIVEHFEATRER